MTVTPLSTGSITISGNDATVATASISGGVITITNVNTVGIKNTSLTVSVASDAHYTAATATISIKAGIKIVTWANGTDSEIAAMVSSHMAGALDLTDYNAAVHIHTRKNTAGAAVIYKAASYAHTQNSGNQLAPNGQGANGVD